MSIAINTELIKEPAGKGMARSIRKGLDAFYADPENRKKFEEWQEKRRKNDDKEK